MFVHVLSLVLFLSAASAVTIKSSCEDRIAYFCSEEQPRRPVCGTDNLTYSSRCDLVKEQCRREATPVLPGGAYFKLYMRNKGPCHNHDRPRTTGQSCWTSRQAAERAGKHAYIPRCLSDGTFAPVQCHKATNTCWCVNLNGKPISKELVKNATPNCSRPGKRRQGIHLRGSLSPVTRRRRKDCGPWEKYSFFLNLSNIYRVEYNRTLKVYPNLHGGELATVAADWKFSTLDKDNDGSLSKLEYSSMRKVLRKVLKPKECTRDWLAMCDSDGDWSLSRTEWITCHTPIGPPTTFPITNRRRNGNGGNENGKRNRDRHRNIGIVTPGKNPPAIASDHFDKTLREKVPNIYSSAEVTSEKKDDHQEANDCLSDSRQLTEGSKQNDRLYVPQCAPDGRYLKIQCYNSTGYCWCVDEDNGKPIPGTSVKDLNPNCDPLPTPPRPMKGCPEGKKQIFLKDLMEYMNETMLKKELKVDHSPGSVLSSGNVEEKIATWNFLALDENRNKVLERKEWATLRRALEAEKKLRRCGKKLPRYCDVNHDKKITLTEWLNCLRTSSYRPSALGDGKRKGKNPIESILKDD